MNLKPLVTRNAPQCIAEAFQSEVFALTFFSWVCGAVLEVNDASTRPAEFCVEKPGEIVSNPGVYAVQVSLMVVERKDYSVKTLNLVLTVLHEFVKQLIEEVLLKNKHVFAEIQIATLVVFDGDVEILGGFGKCSNTHKKVEWVSSLPTSTDNREGVEAGP